MSELDEEFYDFRDFQNAIEAATAKLRRANEMQKRMRWQFEEPMFFTEFLDTLEETKGWISSHC